MIVALLRMVAVAVAAASQLPAPEAQAADKDGQVKVTQQWRMESKTGKPNWNVIPESGVVTNAREWERLWKAWFADKEVPAVDFNKEIVLVAGVQGWVNELTICDATLDSAD